MLVRCLAFLLPLVLAGGVAFGQQRDRPIQPTAPEQKSAQDTQTIQARVAYWLKTCLEDWDKSTHMTKTEWRTTCQRVAAERGRFLTENAITVEPKSRR